MGILSTAVNWLLGLGSSLIVMIVLIILGLIIIGGTSLLNHHDHKPHLKGILLALGVAIIISVYTFVDGIAVKQQPEAVLPYALSMFALVRRCLSLRRWEKTWG